MSAEAQGRVVCVQLADAANGSHGSVYAHNEIGEGARASQLGPMQPSRCLFEDGSPNPSLVRQPLLVGPLGETCPRERLLEGPQIPEVTELEGGLRPVATNVVSDDRGNRVQPPAPSKAAAALVRPLNSALPRLHLPSLVHSLFVKS
jgi:hypothetical protein